MTGRATSKLVGHGSQSAIADGQSPESVQGVSTGYRTIVADPPWPFQWGGGKGGRRRRETELGYSTMTIEEICALPVGDLADPEGCHLYLWMTDEINRNGQGVRVANAWGFRVCGPCLVWSKPNFGMGYFPRPSHEIVLVCRRGHLPYALNNVASVQTWNQDRGRRNGGKQHSRKPDGFLDLVETNSPEPRLELFARRQRLGWHTWGNEALDHVGHFSDTSEGASTLGGAWDTADGPEPLGHFTDTDPSQTLTGSQSV